MLEIRIQGLKSEIYMTGSPQQLFGEVMTAFQLSVDRLILDHPTERLEIIKGVKKLTREIIDML